MRQIVMLIVADHRTLETEFFDSFFYLVYSTTERT